MIYAVQTLGVITTPPIIFPTPVSGYPEGLVVVRCGDGRGDSRVDYIMLPDRRCPLIPVFPFGFSPLIISRPPEVTHRSFKFESPKLM